MAPPSKKKKKSSSSSSVASHSDFTKAKSSLKAKQRAVPNNATNTSFKARSIVLPNQGSITQLEQRRATKLTDDRGRGIEELVGLLRGVGQGGSKGEALDSLSTLLLRLPDGITTGLGLLPILLPLVTSSSSQVRTALYRFLQRFLESVPRDALTPYITTITLWLTSGMNHIWKEVREDAARIAEVVIEITSHDLVRGWTWTSSTAQTHAEEVGSNGGRFFRTLLTALGVSFDVQAGISTGSGEASSSTMNVQSDLSTSPTTKLRLLNCLEKLMWYQSGLGDAGERSDKQHDEAGPSTSMFPFWIFRSVFENPTDWENFVSNWEGKGAHVDLALYNREAERREIAPFTAGSAILESQKDIDFADVSGSAGLVLMESELTQTLNNSNSFLLGNALTDDINLHWQAGTRADRSRTTSIRPYLRLYHALHPLLLHTFLDHAPTTLGPAAPNTNRGQDIPLGLKLIDAVLTLTQTLFRATLRSDDQLSTGAVHSLRGPEKEALNRLGVLLGHTSIYFPFEGILGGEEESKRATLLKKISSAWCELVGLQQMLSGEGPSAPASKKRKGKNAGETTLHLETVESYLVDLLEVSSRQQKKDLHEIVPSVAPSGRLSESEYLSLLPTIWHLLTSSPSSAATTTPASTNTDHVPLLSSILSHWSSLKPSNPLKAHGFTFLACLCSLPNYPSLRRGLRKSLTRPSSPIARLLRSEFLAEGNQVGRYLYELASSLPSPPSTTSRPTRSAPSSSSSTSYNTTRIALEQIRKTFSLLLLDGLQCDSMYILESAHFHAKLLPTLVPFFWIRRSSRGEMAGPWRKIVLLANSESDADADSRGGGGGVWRKEARMVRRSIEAFVRFIEEESSQVEGDGPGGTTPTPVIEFLEATRKAGVMTT